MRARDTDPIERQQQHPDQADQHARQLRHVNRSCPPILTISSTTIGLNAPINTAWATLVRSYARV